MPATSVNETKDAKAFCVPGAPVNEFAQRSGLPKSLGSIDAAVSRVLSYEDDAETADAAADCAELPAWVAEVEALLALPLAAVAELPAWLAEFAALVAEVEAAFFEALALLSLLAAWFALVEASPAFVDAVLALVEAEFADVPAAAVSAAAAARGAHLRPHLCGVSVGHTSGRYSHIGFRSVIER